MPLGCLSFCELLCRHVAGARSLSLCVSEVRDGDCGDARDHRMDAEKVRLRSKTKKMRQFEKV